MHHKTYHVYILKCADDSYYTGVTNNVELRFAQHNSGVNPECYTYPRRPVELVFSYQFKYVNNAITFEKQVKGWSRKKKEAIIGGNWEALRELAECMNKTTWKRER
ncbi:GIY-YIG nuclease family protein [Dyadobacter sp. Leaf189]|uniref:GIY-YIG nuclease family protein n=1 Tax=Dyadobacter sp. Leaf189 TaxID=1736295 RepID=UPI0006FD41BF|nr:GIY-YIG nuclease family protein [Dyadobacter sp. Leaf189]KQS27980.1 excinuclease ABC subunit C [Dyadobacter sp. Leaf189]